MMHPTHAVIALLQRFVSAQQHRLVRTSPVVRDMALWLRAPLHKRPIWSER